jgi:hypothetical protein
MSTPKPPISDLPDEAPVPATNDVLKNSGGKGGVSGPRDETGRRGG